MDFDEDVAHIGRIAVAPDMQRYLLTRQEPLHDGVDLVYLRKEVSASWRGARPPVPLDTDAVALEGGLHERQM